jgi:hypothetical protein
MCGGNQLARGEPMIIGGCFPALAPLKFHRIRRPPEAELTPNFHIPEGYQGR